MNRVVIGCTLSILALAGGASADNEQKPARESCAFVRMIHNFTPVDNYSAIVHIGPSKRYLVKFANLCRELKWSWSARVVSRPGICLAPGDVIVAGDSFGMVDRCYVRSVTLLPPEKVPTPASY